MTESRWDAQPTELAYAPPRYPSHDYSGEGTIVVLRSDVGPAGVVGWLTRQGDAVGFLPRGGLDNAGTAVRIYVQDALREGAFAEVPLEVVWDGLLETVWHDTPVTGPLDGLRGYFG